MRLIGFSWPHQRSPPTGCGWIPSASERLVGLHYSFARIHSWMDLWNLPMTILTALAARSLQHPPSIFGARRKWLDASVGARRVLTRGRLPALIPVHAAINSPFDAGLWARHPTSPVHCAEAPGPGELGLEKPVLRWMLDCHADDPPPTPGRPQ